MFTLQRYYNLATNHLQTQLRVCDDVITKTLQVFFDSFVIDIQLLFVPLHPTKKQLMT